VLSGVGEAAPVGTSCITPRVSRRKSEHGSLADSDRVFKGWSEVSRLLELLPPKMLSTETSVSNSRRLRKNVVEINRVIA
jgi:hypothetical protein